MVNSLEPFLSIIVPIYNAEKYLRESIESILHQNYKDFEVILVNDGSKDSSLKICKEFECMDTRVRVISQENRGSIAARKKGISIAKGSYIGFVDSDDWIHPSMYEQLCQMAIEYDADMVLCDYITFYKNIKINTTQGLSEGFYDKERMRKELYPTMLCDSINNSFYKVIPAYWNKIFKKEVINFYLSQLDERVKLGEDMICVYPSLLKAKSIYYLKNQYLYYYRQRNNSMSREYNSQYLNNFSIIVDDLKEYTNYNEQFLVQIAGYICHKVEDTIEDGLASNSIRKLKEMLKKDYKHSELSKLVQKYDKRYLSGFQKLKFFLLSKEAYTMLLLLCKIKQRFKKVDKCIEKYEYYQ